MTKSVFSEKQKCFRLLLIETRKAATLSQAELGLGRSRLPQVRQVDAFGGIVRLVRGVVTDMGLAKEPIPVPMALQLYRGEFRVRIPPHLHRRLAAEAAEAKVSLNRLVSAKLAQS